LPAILGRLAERAEDVLILVGHEPTLSQLVETYCTGRVWGCVQLKKAGCACVQFPSDQPPAAGKGVLVGCDAALNGLNLPKIDHLISLIRCDTKFLHQEDPSVFFYLNRDGEKIFLYHRLILQP
jgi:hypothetical protein